MNQRKKSDQETTSYPSYHLTYFPNYIHDMELASGAKIGSYQILGEVGRGGQGVVYLARSEHLKRFSLRRAVAIKILSTGTKLNPNIVALQHPSILRLFDYGTIGDSPFMVTEYMKNGSLKDRLTPSALTGNQTISILRPVGQAIDYARSQNILHLHIRPSNIFMDDEFKPVLGDFGLDSSHQLESTSKSQETLAYASPEQVKGKKVTHLGDIYSLSVLAYRLLTGRLPQGPSLSPKASSEGKSDLNKAVAKVLLKGLAPKERDRWRNCKEMVEALELALQGQLKNNEMGWSSSYSKTYRPLVVALGLISLMLLGGTSWHFLGPPERAGNLTLSSTDVYAGDSVTVSAAQLPPGQLLTLQLEEGAKTLRLETADQKGKILVAIIIPLNTTQGPHLLRLCYNQACPLENQILVKPTPSSRRSLPHLTNSLTITGEGPYIIGDVLTVDGAGLDAAKLAKIGIFQNSSAHELATLDLNADGTFHFSGIIYQNYGSGTLSDTLVTGNAVLMACNLDSSNAMSIDFNGCLQLPIRLQ